MSKYLLYSFILTLVVGLPISIWANPRVVQRVENVVIPTRTVEIQADVYGGVGGYYTHAQNQVQGRPIQDIQQQLDAQTKIMQAILDQIKAGNTPIPTPQPQPTPGPSPTPTPLPPQPNPPTPTPSPTPNPLDNTTALEKKVAVIFASQCYQCHSQTNKGGGLSLINNGQLADLDLVEATLINHRVLGQNLDIANGETRMPKGGPPLPADQLETIRLWTVEMAKSIKAQTPSK